MYKVHTDLDGSEVKLYNDNAGSQTRRSNCMVVCEKVGALRVPRQLTAIWNKLQKIGLGIVRVRVDLFTPTLSVDSYTP
jgi:hypothetical protein